MEELVRYIVSNMVENPEDANVTSEKESDKVTIIHIRAKKDAIGKIIGKNGKLANSIRLIVKSASLKSNVRYVVKISELESV